MLFSPTLGYVGTPLPIGKGIVLEQGTDVALLGYGKYFPITTFH